MEAGGCFQCRFVPFLNRPAFEGCRQRGRTLELGVFADWLLYGGLCVFPRQQLNQG